MEKLIGNTNNSEQVRNILDACGYSEENAPNQLVEEVVNTLKYTKNTFSDRASTKTNATYDIARIGLYSDGNIENSPFDLIEDLKEIDKIIFTQELEYE